MKTVYPDENNVVLNENSVEEKPCINREIKIDELTIQLYSCYDVNMNFLAVVTPPPIYQVQFPTSEQLELFFRCCRVLGLVSHNTLKTSYESIEDYPDSTHLGSNIMEGSPFKLLLSVMYFGSDQGKPLVNYHGTGLDFFPSLNN